MPGFVTQGRNKNKSKVFIYNVSKKLVNQRGDSCVVNFKYADSSDGYGNFVVDKSCVTDSANPKFYNITMSADKDLRLNYKDGGQLTSVMMSPENIKKTFELTRVSNKPKVAVKESRESSRDVPFAPFDDIPEIDYSPFD